MPRDLRWIWVFSYTCYIHKVSLQHEISNAEDQNFHWSFLNIQYSWTVFPSSMNPLILSFELSVKQLVPLSHTTVSRQNEFSDIAWVHNNHEASATNDTFMGSSSWRITLLVGKSELRLALLLPSSNPRVLAPMELSGAEWLARNATEFFRDSNLSQCYKLSLNPGSWEPLLKLFPMPRRKHHLWFLLLQKKMLCLHLVGLPLLT